MKTKKIQHALAICAIVLLGFSNASRATVISGSANAYGAFADLGALSGTLTLTAGPIPAGVSVNAPAPGSASDSLLNLNASASANLVAELQLNTGLLTANASSDVDGLSGSRTSSADATVHDLSMSGKLPGSLLNVIDISATTLFSEAMVSGDNGSFTATGSSTLENLFISIDGIGDISLNASTGPNSILYNALGLQIVANEQIGNCLASLCELEVNALHIIFDDFAFGTGLLNGDLVIAHSYASLNSTAAVPVPAALPLLLSGIGLLFAVSRKRKAV